MSIFKSQLHKLYASPQVQIVLARCSLNEAHNQQIIALILAAALALVLLSVAGYRWVKSVSSAEANQGIGAIPVDINHATDVCNAEMKERLGEKLLRSYVDDHSTRLDNAKGMFRIYIKADIGDIRDFREIDVYCFVDKWDQSLAHYREIDPTVKRITTSDLKFFQD